MGLKNRLARLEAVAGGISDGEPRTSQDMSDAQLWARICKAHPEMSLPADGDEFPDEQLMAMIEADEQLLVAIDAQLAADEEAAAAGGE